MLTYFRCTDYIRSEYVVPTKRAISEELLRKSGYSLSSRYFPIHSCAKSNKRLDKTRINENFGQCSFLSLVRHFECFENDHRRCVIMLIMVGDADHCFRFFQNWHTPELFRSTQHDDSFIDSFTLWLCSLWLLLERALRMQKKAARIISVAERTTRHAR